MWQKLLKKNMNAGNEIIVVVSAMSGKTNELLKQSKRFQINLIKENLMFF